MNKQLFLKLAIGTAITMTISTNLVYADTPTPSYQRKNTVSAQLPDFYPSHFPALGVLTDIRGQYDWVINGKAIKVSSNVLVHSLVTNFSSMYSIKQGMELAYRINNKGEVAEVWAMPDGAIDRN